MVRLGGIRMLGCEDGRTKKAEPSRESGRMATKSIVVAGQTEASAGNWRVADSQVKQALGWLKESMVAIGCLRC